MYKITFEEVPYYYYGVHKEKYFNEEYFGSPITHKWCWEFYTPKKQILEFFNCWEEAQEVEKRLIKPFYNTDKWCLNENIGGVLSLEVYRKGGKKVKELGIGIFGRTKREKIEHASKNGKLSYELGIGIHGRSKEKMSEDAKKAAKVINSQKWMCLETKFVSTFGPLTRYQRKRNIDTSKRVRVS